MRGARSVARSALSLLVVLLAMIVVAARLPWLPHAHSHNQNDPVARQRHSNSRTNSTAWQSHPGANSTVRLSIPVANDTARAARVNHTAQLLQNVPRWIVLSNVSVSADAAVADNSSLSDDRNSSLYAQLLVEQDALLCAAENPTMIRRAVASALPLATRNESEFHRAYSKLVFANMAQWPQATCASDGAFGKRRLGILGHRLELVSRGAYTEQLDQLDAALVRDVCAQHDITTAVANKTVFVANFDSMGQYTAERQSDRKYVPGVTGFFCAVRSERDATLQLLPLAIRIIDTGLLYTKRDSAADWTLAKMALDATELNHLHAQRIALVHNLLAPIQIELIRSMAPQHPVHALLQYHLAANLALKHRMATTLLVAGSDFDSMFAFGAAGTRRFAARKMGHRVNESFVDELQRNGLGYLETHRLVRCGAVYSTAITAFVHSYVQAFYTSETAVQYDEELQRWAARASKLPGVQGFPERFTGHADLTTVLANLVFQSTVWYYAMHGPSTWDAIAAPYTTPALRNKPLPKMKGTDVDPLDYAIDPALLPALSAFAASAMHAVPSEMSMLHAYNVTPFIDEPKLAAPIARFQRVMQHMEEWIDGKELEGQNHGNIRPSTVPVFSYA